MVLCFFLRCRHKAGACSSFRMVAAPLRQAAYSMPSRSNSTLEGCVEIISSSALKLLTRIVAVPSLEC